MLLRRLFRPSPSRPAKFLLAVSVALAAGAHARAARAQELVLPAQPAPPPMKYVPDDVRARLAATSSSPKDRVVATLALLEQFLARAEAATASQRYDPAAADLGVYQALLDDLLAYLKPVGRSPQGKADSKTRDLYKRIELTLNKHTARIESVRRMTPAPYAGNIRAAFLHARDRRTEALEAFFVETIVKIPKDSAGAQPDPPKETPPAKKPAEKPPAP